MQADTSGATIDQIYGQTTLACSSPFFCLRLHNGGVLFFTTIPLGGTATTNAAYFKFDPDGHVTDGTTNGPGKSVSIFVYYNGRLADEGEIAPGTKDYYGTYTANPSLVPPWFSW